MSFTHQYPICEFDTERKAVICAANFLEKVLPEKCVLTFFRKELNAPAEETTEEILQSSGIST